LGLRRSNIDSLGSHHDSVTAINTNEAASGSTERLNVRDAQWIGWEMLVQDLLRKGDDHTDGEDRTVSRDRQRKESGIWRCTLEDDLSLELARLCCGSCLGETSHVGETSHEGEEDCRGESLHCRLGLQKEAEYILDF